MMHRTARRTVRTSAVAACLVMVVACGSASHPPAKGGSPTPTPAKRPSVTTISLPSPGSVVTAFGSVWVTNGPAQTVTRINPATNAVLASIPTPDPASVVAAGAGAVWVTSYPGNSLMRIDPAHDKVTRRISLAPAGGGAIGVTVYAGFVWVANHHGEPRTSISKINPVTMRVVDVIRVGPDDTDGPQWVLSSAGSIWTNVNSAPNVIVRIDPRTDRILATIPAPSACAQLAADDTSVWGASGDDGSCPYGVNRIDTNTNTVTGTFDQGGPADAVALDNGTLWYGTTTSHQLGRIDTRTNRFVSLSNLPGPAFGMTVGAGAIWTTDRDDGLLFKIAL